MSACKHLSTSLMQLLLEAEVRQLSLGALQQFNLDVEECERKGLGVLRLGEAGSFQTSLALWIWTEAPGFGTYVKGSA